jgi:MBG domain (YGX type)
VSAGGACSISGGTVTMTGGSGTCTLTATQSGNADYAAATDVVRTVAAAKASRSITFGPLAGKTYGDDDFSVGGSASSGPAVGFTASGDCSVSGSTVHITGAGSCTITASQSGDDKYDAAPAVQQAFAIAKHALSVTADDKHSQYPADRPAFSVSYAGFVNGDGPGSLGGSLSCDTTPASTAASPHAGSYAINCSGLTSGNYDITYKPGTLTVDKGDQTTTFPAIGAHVYLDSDFDPGALASSGLPVSYSTGAADQCTIVDGKVHITGAGSCTVTASQAGNANFNAASAVPRALPRVPTWR